MVYGFMISVVLHTSADSLDVTLLVHPNPANISQDVTFNCRYNLGSSGNTNAYIQLQSSSKGKVWRRSWLYGTITTGPSYTDRIYHQTQSDYSTNFTITLKDVTPDDADKYVCYVHKQLQGGYFEYVAGNQF